LQKIFRTIPRMIGKKVKYSNFSREDRSQDIKYTIDLLSKARICSPVYRVLAVRVRERWSKGCYYWGGV
jgi:hypothetical protein